jgi:hypothetical protein
MLEDMRPGLHPHLSRVRHNELAADGAKSDDPMARSPDDLIFLTFLSLHLRTKPAYTLAKYFLSNGVRGRTSSVLVT